MFSPRNIQVLLQLTYRITSWWRHDSPFVSNLKCVFLCADWHKATQGLFGGGIILLFIALMLSSFHLCCRCCKESFSITSVLGSFIITGCRWTQQSSLLLSSFFSLQLKLTCCRPFIKNSRFYFYHESHVIHLLDFNFNSGGLERRCILNCGYWF